MKHPDSILEACISRIHAAVLHENALQCKKLPEFSPILNAERQDIKNKAQGDKLRNTRLAKGAVRG